MITVDYNLFEEHFSSGDIRISTYPDNNFYLEDGVIKCYEATTTSMKNNIAGDLVYGPAIQYPPGDYLPSQMKFVGLNQNASRKKLGDPYPEKEGCNISRVINKMFGGK